MYNYYIRSGVGKLCANDQRNIPVNCRGQVGERIKKIPGQGEEQIPSPECRQTVPGPPSGGRRDRPVPQSRAVAVEIQIEGGPAATIFRRDRGQCAQETRRTFGSGPHGVGRQNNDNT